MALEQNPSNDAIHDKEIPCYDLLLERAEDLAFRTGKDLDRATAAVCDAIIRSDLTHVQMDCLANVIASQADISVTSVRFDLFKGRADFERVQASGEQQRPATLLAFLSDKGECLLGEPRTYYTLRAKFYDAYHSWCYRKGLVPLGKHKLYRAVSHPSVSALGVRQGARADGHAVIRGVLWMDGEL